MQIFYHAANMFTDVPHLKGRVKRRKWLDPLFSSIPYGSAQTYDFLFARTVVRTSEFSGLIVRLTVIASILVIFTGSLYFSLAISLLFLYLTGFQLLPLLRRHDFIIWTELYPLGQWLQKKGFSQFAFKSACHSGCSFRN